VFLGQIYAGEETSESRTTDVHVPVAEQMLVLLWRLGAALTEHELTFEDLLRLRLFVDDLDELPAIARAMNLEEVQWPAVSIIELPVAGRGERATPTLDAVAAPGAHAQRQLRHVAALDRSAKGSEMTIFHRSARFGPWVFLSAISAVDVGRTSAHPCPPAHTVPQRIGEEARVLFTGMEELLCEQGAELSDVVKVDSWLTFPMRDYGPLAEVRETLLDRTGMMPASAGVQVARVSAGDELLACEAIAFAPLDGGAERRHDSEPAPAASRLARYYADARTAGGYAFTSGEVPDGRGSAQAQAREVYERLRSHLAAHDASPTDVVQQTVFVRRAGEGDVIAAAAREFYGADTPIPPTTLLTVADIGFHPGCDVEIELVATPTGSAPMPDDSPMNDAAATTDPLELDLAALDERERYFLLTSVVVPRPIAWVSTLAPDGTRNLAPYSYFNACSATPPIVHFTSTTSRDSLANVKATGEFVVNVVDEELAPAMRVSSAALYSGEDEFEVAGLQTVPSRTVAPPRVAGAKVALECRLRQLLEMGEGTMVFGDVLHIHVERSVWRDGRVDPKLLRPVGRLSAPYFATVSEVYSLELPEDVKRRASDYTIRGCPAGPGGSA
jgi:flavin reductase (DIM6/NTAB) family NADH-FMN oxidoreductase RutF/enamine deaminase RidA (YjgF/YER057c/UK114 family)